MQSVASIHLSLTWSRRKLHDGITCTNHRCASDSLDGRLRNPPPVLRSNRETVTTNFEVKPEKTVITGFKVKPEKTVTTGFEVKPEKTVTTGFEVKPEKIIWVVLRSNHWQTVDLDFDAQLRNQRSSYMVQTAHSVTDISII
jgi:hypothetical protein